VVVLLIVAGLRFWAGATLLIDAWLRRRLDRAERRRPFQLSIRRRSRGVASVEVIVAFSGPADPEDFATAVVALPARPHPTAQIVALDGKVSDPADGDYGLLLPRCFAAAANDLDDRDQTGQGRPVLGLSHGVHHP
jgi:hypothetical protein